MIQIKVRPEPWSSLKRCWALQFCISGAWHHYARFYYINHYCFRYCYKNNKHLFLMQIIYFVTSKVRAADNSTQWENKHINCDCTILCDMQLSCSNSTVICPNEHQCTIICSETQSCKHINIISPQDETLFTLSFSGEQALSGVTYPIYPLTCEFDKQCAAMNVICPCFARCRIECAATQACSYV